MAGIGTSAYAGQLRALLPRGRAWSGGRVLPRLLDGLAAGLQRLDARGGGLLRESIPWLSTELLPDWEHEFGLPDECSSLASTISERRAAVLLKAVSRANLNASAFVAIAASFGVDARVDEHDQTRAEAEPGLDVSNGRWRFVWWILLDTSADFRRFNTLSPVNTPLLTFARNTELECRLVKLAPAHTVLLVGYGAIA